MIGIITRLDLSRSNNEIYVTYKAIIDVNDRFKQISIGIVPGEFSKVKEVIDMCDGIILQGGDFYTNLDLEIVKYLYDNDIPTLGICLGMQSMGEVFGGTMERLPDNSHYSTKEYVHKVNIKNSKIYPDKKINVNSRHNDYLKYTGLTITGISDDGIIEMIEDKTKRFFVGVQWHPENMFNYDEDALFLFEKFFEATKK